VLDYRHVPLCSVKTVNFYCPYQNGIPHLFVLPDLTTQSIRILKGNPVISQIILTVEVGQGGIEKVFISICTLGSRTSTLSSKTLYDRLFTFKEHQLLW
jgi:hypothetical protein